VSSAWAINTNISCQIHQKSHLGVQAVILCILLFDFFKLGQLASEHLCEQGRRVELCEVDRKEVSKLNNSVGKPIVQTRTKEWLVPSLPRF
jgi:hypothetical protein